MTWNAWKAATAAHFTSCFVLTFWAFTQTRQSSAVAFNSVQSTACSDYYQPVAQYFSFEAAGNIKS